MTDADRIIALERELEDFRGQARQDMRDLKAAVDHITQTCEGHRVETRVEIAALREVFHQDALRIRNALIAFVATIVGGVLIALTATAATGGLG